MTLGNCIHVFRPYFGPHQYSVNQLWQLHRIQQKRRNNCIQTPRDASFINIKKELYHNWFIREGECTYGTSSRKSMIPSAENYLLLWNVQMNQNWQWALWLHNPTFVHPTLCYTYSLLVYEPSWQMGQLVHEKSELSQLELTAILTRNKSRNF